MTETIDVTCGACGERNSFRRSLLGRIVECPSCGKRLTVTGDEFEPEVVDDAIVIPEPTPEVRRLRAVPVVTAPVYLQPGQQMVETGQQLSAHRAIGTSVLTDALVAITDLTGARSKRVEELTRQLHSSVVNELGKLAAARGYDAVVSLRVDFSELGKSVLYVTATGTPVKMADVE